MTTQAAILDEVKRLTYSQHLVNISERDKKAK
jgi:hypothetical protein